MIHYINKKKVRCPRCGAKTRPSVTIKNTESEFFVECVQCPTYINTFIPLPHQYAFLRDPSRYTLNAGGIGTGKTSADVMDHIKHMALTPNGQSLLGAPTMPQLKSTLKKDLEATLPSDFVEQIIKQDNMITYVNGHQMIYRPFDDPEKLKSLNLSYFVILEASRTKYSVFTELQRRLRNNAAVKYAYDEENDPILEEDEEGRMVQKIERDWRKGNLESNPDAGWVKSGVLERSGTVYLHHKDLHNEGYYFRSINPSISTHIAPTKANHHLPKNFINDQSQGMPEWYVRQNFYGSFAFAEGMIYPNFMRNVVTPFPIPRNWKRIISMDYGINDNTHILFGAIDPKENICYIYDELVISDADVSTIAKEYKRKVMKIPFGAFLTTPVMDQRSFSKRQSHDVEKTLGTLFMDEGLFFEPAQMNMEARIIRGNTLLNKGQLKIFNNCTELIDEGRNYKFPEKSMDKPNQDTNKPVDKFNHGMNAMEFLVMELPHNLEEINFKMYNNKGKAYSDTLTNEDPTPRPFNPLEEGEPDYDSHYSNADYLFDPFSD